LKLVEDNYSLSTPEVQLIMNIKIGRRQLQFVKPEVHLQLNLIA
jgi:hypothetical protein